MLIQRLALAIVACISTTESFAQSPSKKLAAGPPFVVDSSYDRFADETKITLRSRDFLASNGISFRYITTCKANGKCGEDAFVLRYLYGYNGKPTVAQRRLYDALSGTAACFELVFYKASGPPERGTSCFQSLGSTAMKEGAAAVGIEQLASENAERFATSDSVAGRIMGSRIEFSVHKSELGRVAAFWAAFKARGS